MSLANAKRDALRLLLNGYKEQPGSYHNISPTIHGYGFDAFDVAKSMEREGLVKNVANNVPIGVCCEITMEGIAEIDPKYINDLFFKTMSTLGPLGGAGSLKEALDTKDNEYQLLHNFAFYLYDTGYIKQPLPNPFDIQIEFSPKGWDYYENNRALFHP